MTRDLREKFLKFSNRIIPPRREDDLKKTIQLTNEQKVFGEFSSLVAPKIEDNVSTTITELEQKLSDENRSLTLATIEKYYLDKNKYTTLSEVKEKLSTALEKNKQLNPLDQLIVQSKSNDSIAFSEVPEPTEMKSVYAKPKNSSVFGDMNQLSEPEVEKVYFKRVRIPKSVYKKGCTYKINDCYYDHDGQFLYRVPGLTGQFQD